MPDPESAAAQLQATLYGDMQRILAYQRELLSGQREMRISVREVLSEVGSIYELLKDVAEEVHKIEQSVCEPKIVGIDVVPGPPTTHDPGPNQHT